MATQEEWRRIAYERSEGLKGASMGTMDNAQGLATFRAQRAESAARHEAIRSSFETPRYTPPPVAPVTRPDGATGSGTGTGPLTGPGGGTVRLSFIDHVSIALDVTDAEDFWNLSDWMFGPLERRMPRRAGLWAMALGVLVALAVALSAGMTDGAILLFAASGAVAPLLAYAALRLSVSLVTFLAGLALILGFYGLILAAVVAAGAGLFLALRWVLSLV
ncbi:hypothetical protein HKCCE2091_21095 [Rhodobacterales bacterium HKCCE2091]|nr:hypothetical protein [Rhodobacterales bacterium HKCCE2091]